jgi:hypothetical protein
MRSHRQTQGGHNQKLAESQKHEPFPSAPPAFSAYGKRGRRLRRGMLAPKDYDDNATVL